MGVDCSEIVRLMDVSAMFYKCTYCVFTSHGSYEGEGKGHMSGRGSWLGRHSNKGVERLGDIKYFG